MGRKYDSSEWYEREAVEATITSGATVTPMPLATGTNYVGLATVDVGSALPAGANYVGLATVVVGTGTSYMGLATVDVGSEFVPGTVVEGFVSTASGALTQFPANSVKEVNVRAWTGNATTCAVGSSSATYPDGYQLAPGDDVTIRIDNTNKVYLAGRDTSAVTFIGTN